MAGTTKAELELMVVERQQVIDERQQLIDQQKVLERELKRKLESAEKAQNDAELVRTDMENRLIRVRFSIEAVMAVRGITSYPVTEYDATGKEVKALEHEEASLLRYLLGLTEVENPNQYRRRY